MLRRSRVDHEHDERKSLIRVHVLMIIFFSIGVAVIARMFQLQVLDHDQWLARAATQQERNVSLFPARGSIMMHDGNSLYPLATNRTRFFLYAVPNEIENPRRTARLIAPLLQADEEAIFQKLNKPNDPWEPLQHRVDQETADAIMTLALPGIGRVTEPSRYYPEKNIASHVLGFVRADGETLIGQYGVEGYFDALLRGKEGALRGITDARGEVISGLGGDHVPAEDGVMIVLTLDRNIQFFACNALAEVVREHGASGGSVVILDPKTGAIRAMCGVPDFDPNNYNAISDPFIFNNPTTFFDYEPGSIFKPITMAAGIETGVVSPETTYEDQGYVRLGVHTIRNSDNKAHGTRTMTQVLQESLNTGAIFVARKMEKEVFRTFVHNFGFGKQTGIGLATEVAGDMRSLDKDGEIFTATASYGQGITVTPLQMAVAYGALANGGMLLRPYIVDEIRYPDGRKEVTHPEPVRRVVSERTSALISGMLVSVVREGHGKRADVSGYTVAGKTGTAQIARRDGPGYEANAHIGSFVGYAPIEDPKFVMLTKIDRPKDVQFAESTAAPLFGKIAQFLLEYYQIAPMGE